MGQTQRVHHSGFIPIRGLVRGLQLELGMSDNEVDGVYGDTLHSRVPFLNPTGGNGEANVRLVQSALRVKGYDASPVDDILGGFGDYNDRTIGAVNALRNDANYTTLAGTTGSGGGVVDREVWKGLCSQDAYVLVQGGDAKLRTIQQRLNDAAYQPQMGLNPTDGIITPQLARGLMKALQILLGIANPDGIWGPKTANAVRAQGPIDAPGQQWTRLLAYALYVNEYTDMDVNDPSWSAVAQRARGFGLSLRLNVTDTGPISTLIVAALFVSYGDQQRGYDDLRWDADPTQPTIGIDTASRLTDLTRTFELPESDLYQMHVGFVGRYLQNAPDPVLDKEMTIDEIYALAELSTSNAYGTVPFGIAPIWQTSANDGGYFIPGRGTSDAQAADTRAEAFGIPKNVTIYFAVDFDAFGSTIEDLIIPYFRELNDEMSAIGGNPIGAYGPRAVCNRLAEEGLATASYVGNLSYGWTGNLGQKMPSNWAIDQFFEFEADFYDADGTFIGTHGVDQLIHNPENGQLWYPEPA
ncbi:DUF1906 domain-containing protein [Brevibacterium linens ATCC 9172]|nr:DUF1906 domain-containing protein [Brevibacterium linens ATCC 9172]